MNYIVKKILFYIFLNLFLIQINSFCQNNNNISNTVLTHKEMYKDFDYFVQILDSVYPLLEPYRVATGYNMKQTILQYRNIIDTCAQNASFINQVIAPALSACNELHIRLVFPGEIIRLLKNISTMEQDTTIGPEIAKYIRHYKAGILFYIDTAFFNETRKMMKYYKPIDNIFPAIFVDYYGGDYYTTRMFKYKGKKYPYGLKIETVNGLHPDTIIKRYSLFQQNYIHWDVNNKKFYSNYFYGISEFLNKPVIFTFKDNKDKIYEIDITDKSFKGWGWYLQINKSKVYHFKKQKLLYVKLVEMDENSNITQKMLRKGKNKSIQNVIIDLRNNPGGNDLTWMNLLKHIIDTPLHTSVYSATFDNEIIKKYIYNPQNEALSIPIYGKDKKFLKIKHDADFLQPNDNGLKYKGTIKLIQNRSIFSSAMSMSAFAWHSPKLISIGESTGYTGGLGSTPLYFMLPHSKLIFAVVPDIPAANITTIDDIFNKVEVPVFLSPKDKKIIRTKGWRNSKHYLKKHDPYFRKALEIK